MDNRSSSTSQAASGTLTQQRQTPLAKVMREVEKIEVENQHGLVGQLIKLRIWSYSWFKHLHSTVTFHPPLETSVTVPSCFPSTDGMKFSHVLLYINSLRTLTFVDMVEMHYSTRMRLRSFTCLECDGRGMKMQYDRWVWKPRCDLGQFQCRVQLSVNK